MDTSREIETFCQNVSYLRKKYHLPLISMAMLLGISQTSMRLLDKGTLSNRITVDTLYRLHRIFQISIDDLFCTNLEKV